MVQPMDTRQGFGAALITGNRSPEIPESADVYGWLVGSWELQVRRYWGVDVADQRITGEIHFAWVLEGRAVQDVWIMPQRPDRVNPPDKTRNMYGTTLRVWDPAIQAWRIAWMNPAGDHYEQQIGRRIGNEIVQIGTRFDGTPTRWTFTDIAAGSFHWLGEALEQDGRTWRLEGEFYAKRVS
jgi:hypothetical protein